MYGKSFKYAAGVNIYERNKLDRQTNNTDIVEELVQLRQNLKNEGKVEAADWMTKTI